jgi:hypothetical protein
MKTILYLLLFISSFHTFSQQKAIEITNIKNGKTHVYTENQRVKIRTLDRKKHLGKIHFSDLNTLMVDNKSIQTDSILSIKRQPIILGTIKTGLFLTGIATVGASLVNASSGKDSAIILFLAGSGATISAGLIEGLNTKYSNKKWSYKIIEK